MERPLIKDKAILAYVQEIEGKLSIYESSPIVESYLTIYFQVKSFNQQLQLGEQKTEIGENGISVTIQNGFVDLFAGKDDKSFDRTKWYFENILALNKTLDELRKLMTPEEKDVVEKRLLEEAGSAEHLALKHTKNGTNK